LAKPKLFLISPHLDGNVNSTGYYWSEIRRWLIEAGHDVETITAVQEDSRGWSALRRASHEVLVALKLLGAVVRKAPKGAQVWSGTNPVFLLPFIAGLAHLLSLRWVVVVYDVFPYNLLAVGEGRFQRIVLSLAAPIFRWAYRSASVSIVIGRDMRQQLVAIGVDPNQIQVVANWVDVDAVRPDEETAERMRTESGVPAGSCVFQFFGNLGLLQGIEAYLAMIAATKNPRSVFLFRGAGRMRGAIESFRTRHPDKRIVLLDPPDSTSRNAALTACDVAVVTLDRRMAGFGVPSKTYFNLSADRPVLCIAPLASEAVLTVQEMSVGWCCDPSDIAGGAKLLDQIADSMPFDLSPRAKFIALDLRGRARAAYVAISSAQAA
jgi:glycosyltransferase involved in cell wall biosynthesis